ncbi:MAG: DNA-primase RepB domain-containing protein [Rhizobiaceae bacterium]
MSSSTTQNKYKYLFSDLEDDEATIRDQKCFLGNFWDGYTMADYPSYGIFAFRHRTTKKFVEKSVQIFLPLPKTIPSLLKKYNRWGWDQYFCPNMFFEPRRKKEFARDTRLAWCDVDEADPNAFKPHPSIIWETSPGRTQTLWIWGKEYSPEKAEAYSRSLTYRHRGDKNGWPINKLLRIPGSINHKEGYGEPFIPLVHCDLTPISKRPRPYKIKGRSYGSQIQVLDFDHKAHKRLDVLKKHCSKLDPKARVLIRDKRAHEKDRSAQIYHMVISLHEAGASLDEIASVIWDSPYFQDKYPDEIRALQAELSRIMSKIGGAS